MLPTLGPEIWKLGSLAPKKIAFSVEEGTVRDQRAIARGAWTYYRMPGQDPDRLQEQNTQVGVAAELTLAEILGISWDDTEYLVRKPYAALYRQISSFWPYKLQARAKFYRGQVDLIIQEETPADTIMILGQIVPGPGLWVRTIYGWYLAGEGRALGLRATWGTDPREKLYVPWHKLKPMDTCPLDRSLFWLEERERRRRLA